MGSGGRLRRLAGIYLVPHPLLPMPAWPAIEDMERAPLAALAAPCDFLALDKVAAVVRDRYANVVWIRLATSDADLGALLVTLLGAVERLDEKGWPGSVEAVAHHARRSDWRTAYELSARLLAAATPRPAVVVLEGVERLETRSPVALDLLVSAFLPLLARSDLHVLLIGFREWHARRLDPHAQVLGPSRLRLDMRAVALLAEASLLDLSAALLKRTFALTCGAAGAVQAAFSAGAVLGPEAFFAAAAGAASGRELVCALSRRMLTRASDHTLAALAGASRLGIWHADMATALGHSTLSRNEPWWLDLAEGWRQLNPAWCDPLRSAGGFAVLERASLNLLADHLVRQGAGDRAFELYIQASDVDRAADTAVSIAGDLASAGCWTTLAKMGEALGRDTSAPQTNREPDDPTQHPVSRWFHRFVRRGRRSADQATVEHGTRWPGVSVPVGDIPTRGIGSAHRVTLHARGAGSRWPLGAFATSVEVVPPDMAAHLLGELRIAFHDRPVETWASGRGRAVLEYLLVHRHSKVRRDRLMSVFWPDASPDAARNSLNVAIHGLRHSLRAVAGDRPVVIHRDQAYFIEPTLDLWLDVEAFEEWLASARRHVASAELAKAQGDFEAAIRLYQGEFLADDPYEEWAVVTREHLRLCYLDALDQLSMLRLNTGDYTGCIDVCLKLLTCDTCREDAHCRLMRCYSRLGQLQLALRQYNSCSAALLRELGVAPDPATTELFDHIRRREAI